MKKYFEVNAGKYVPGKEFMVFRPASLSCPKDNAVMFIEKKYMAWIHAFECVEHCLIFWPDEIDIPQEIADRHAVVQCENPHLRYCLFYRENEIHYLPPQEKGNMQNYAFVADTAVLGKNVTVMPGAYIGGEVRTDRKSVV